MRWKAFATDFDGTIATDGTVDEATIESLRNLRAAGVPVLLVTGREMKDFAHALTILDLFDLVVAENGGVLYTPSTQEAVALVPAPPAAFSEELVRRGVPVSVGVNIVATVEPHEKVVLDVIKEMALELQVIFNKGAVMILPAGVNKASGLLVALERLGISPADTVCAGDAENDATFFDTCGFPVAVANALPALKERARFVTRHNAGAGVSELIEKLLAGEFETLPEQQQQTESATPV